MRENKSFYALLGILSFGPHSGYDIKRKFEQQLSHFWYESYGQIYPNLKKLVEAGLATTETVRQERKPDRIVYAITPAGRELLKEWLRAPIDRLPPEKNELLLKLHYGANVAVADNLAHIERYLDKMLELRGLFAMLSKLSEQYGAARGEEPNYGRLTLRFGQQVVEGMIAWCEESIEVLTTYKERESE